MKNRYIFTWLPAALVLCAGAFAQPGRSAKEPAVAVSYRSVEAALKALRADPKVSFSKENGWLIAENSGTTDLWSFAPMGHAAYPTAVLRRVVQQDGQVAVAMDVLCQAPKKACDAVVQEFVALNEKIRSEFR